LAAHGVGIGSFICLRRVFEGLIEEARVQAVKDVNCDEAVYVDLMMKKRVTLLADYLPEFIVKHSNVYGILRCGK